MHYLHDFRTKAIHGSKQILVLGLALTTLLLISVTFASPVTITTIIGDVECGLQWDADEATPDTLERNEYLAKWDCREEGDPLELEGDRLFAKINGNWCGLEWDADAGEPSYAIGSAEHLGKWDCESTGDPIIYDGEYIYAKIFDRECGLVWDFDENELRTTLAGEHIAKFDCEGLFGLIVPDPVFITNLPTRTNTTVSTNVNTNINTNSRLADNAFTIYSVIDGRECGLQWDINEASLATLDRGEHIAKWDCLDGGDPIYVEGNKLVTYIGDNRCSLEWDGNAGTPANAIGSNEHIAKWDCLSNGDPMSEIGDYIVANIYNQSCGLVWDIDESELETTTRGQYIAKFNCDGYGDPIVYYNY